MIIVDKALQERQKTGNPIKVGMIGAGAMGRGIALQIMMAVPGMEIVAISNRTLARARDIYNLAGVEEMMIVDTVEKLNLAIESKKYAITNDAMLLCNAEGIDAILEVTGSIEFGACVALEAIKNRKHIITMNAELNGTIGPLLRHYADEAGVIITDSDGDQPGVIMNLYRFVRGIGCKPVLAGNIKGLHDPYRNPTTQENFARTHGLSANMATSFADGTKISFEMAIVANATGLTIAKRGMHGYACKTLDEAKNLFTNDRVMEEGWVDYVVGAQPSPGVFVLGYHDSPVQKKYLHLYKLGDGPLYTFYRPYHLCHFEVANTIARVVLFNDATITPIGGPVVDVVATAKRNLKAGEVLDGIGFYLTYGLCEKFDIVRKEKLLPIGLSEGCTLIKDIPKDQVLTFNDVEVSEGRISDKLWKKQNAIFAIG
jgi:predicted homoserine dehydrogenase-like protein